MATSRRFESSSIDNFAREEGQVLRRPRRSQERRRDRSETKALQRQVRRGRPQSQKREEEAFQAKQRKAKLAHLEGSEFVNPDKIFDGPMNGNSDEPILYNYQTNV